MGTGVVCQEFVAAGDPSGVRSGVQIVAPTC